MPNMTSLRKQLRDMSVKRINEEFPVGCTMRDKTTGAICVRGAKVRGGKFWIMTTGPNPTKAVIAAELFEVRFEQEES